MFNRIINKIKNQYKYAVYIDKNSNQNNDIDINKNNKIFNNVKDALNTLYNIADIYLQNKNISINAPKYNYTTYLNNIEAGICGDSFINYNGNKVVIEFHVKQLDPNIKSQIMQQLENKYKNQLNALPLNALLDIEEQLESYIINNFYLGIIMIFINNHYITTSEPKIFKRKQYNQLKSIGYQLINKYKQQYL